MVEPKRNVTEKRGALEKRAYFTADMAGRGKFIGGGGGRFLHSYGAEGGVCIKKQEGKYHRGAGKVLKKHHGRHVKRRKTETRKRKRLAEGRRAPRKN